MGVNKGTPFGRIHLIGYPLLRIHHRGVPLLMNMEDYDMDAHIKKVMIWLTIIPLVIFVVGFTISLAFELST